jgi:hypothetical protein
MIEMMESRTERIRSPFHIRPEPDPNALHQTNMLPNGLLLEI